MKKIFSKAFWIKFMLIDLIFFMVFYLTFIFSFPLDKIVKHNKAKIVKSLGKDFTYKSISLTPTLALNIKDLKLKELTKLTQKDINDILKKIKELKSNPKKENYAKDIRKISKQLKIPVDELTLIIKKSQHEIKKELTKGLTIKNLNINPKIMQMISSKKTALDFTASLMGGEIEGTYFVKEVKLKKSKIKRKSKRRRQRKPQELNHIELNLDNVRLTEVSKYLDLKLPIHGNLSGNLELDLKPQGSKMNMTMLKTDLTLNKAIIGPGKIKAMGSYATMNAIRLGSNIKLKGETDKRKKFKFDPIEIDSKDLKASVKGDISFIRNTSLNIKSKFKFTDSFLAANKKIKTIMSEFSKYKRRDKFYGIKYLGTLKRPRLIKYTN